MVFEANQAKNTLLAPLPFHHTIRFARRSSIGLNNGIAR